MVCACVCICMLQGGEVWGWGAGECGQLGSGRVTCRDRPELCIPKSVTTDHFVEVACGCGHVLALSETGRVYCWGLNTKGQLGVGDIKPRYTPVEMELTNGHAVGKLFASEHSSACITRGGGLYTWGSAENHRLMHPTGPMVVTTPMPVRKVEGVVIESFAFSRRQSMALIFTRLLEVSVCVGGGAGDIYIDVML